MRIQSWAERDAMAKKTKSRIAAKCFVRDVSKQGSNPTRCKSPDTLVRLECGSCDTRARRAKLFSPGRKPWVRSATENPSRVAAAQMRDIQATRLRIFENRAVPAGLASIIVLPPGFRPGLIKLPPFGLDSSPLGGRAGLQASVQASFRYRVGFSRRQSRFYLSPVLDPNSRSLVGLKASS